MGEVLTLRAMTDEETRPLRELARSRTAEARLRDRARMCWLASQGQRVSAIKAELGVADGIVRLWLTRFNACGLDGLRDRRRGGLPDVPAGDGRRGHRRQPDGSRRSGVALRELDAGSVGGVPARDARDRHEAQPHRGDLAGRGLALAHPGDLVRRAARPRVR